MTKREFATLLFRVLGLYCAIGIVSETDLMSRLWYWLEDDGRTSPPSTLDIMAFCVAVGPILLQFGLGLIIAALARPLAVWSVGREESGPISVGAESWRFLILWAIGVYFLLSVGPEFFL